MASTSSSFQKMESRDGQLFESFPVKKKSLWKKIAKNEIMIKTSRFRNHRILFFICLYSILLSWTFLLCPYLFDIWLPKGITSGDPLFIPIMAMIMEYMMLTVFLIIMMYPLNVVYRKAEIGFKEILISTPVRAGDIFVGEFLGKLPIYGIVILIFGPVLIGLFNPVINLTFIQLSLIYLSLFGMVIFAILLGSIIASALEHKIAKSEKARDFGKAITMIIAIIMVAGMYAMQFFFNRLIEHPEIKNWFMFYPSLWFSNIILFVIEPALIEDYILNIWSSSALAIGVPLFLLYVALKKAESFYTLEGGIEKTSSNIIGESGFYRTIRTLTGQRWGGLIVVHLKNFFRKKENIIKLVWVGGVGSFMAIMTTINTDLGGIYKDIITVQIVITVGMMFSLMIGSYIFVDSKEILWIFKRSPRNVKGLIYSYIMTLIIINMFLIMLISIVHAIILRFDILEALVHWLLLLIFCSLSIIEVVGIQCFNPSFEEKGRTMRGNIIISFVIHFTILFAILILLINLDLPDIFKENYFKFVFIGPIILLHLGLVFPLFFFGLRRLSKLE